MEITLREVVEATPEIDNFLTTTDIKNSRCAYRIARNLHKLNSEYKVYLARLNKESDPYKMLDDDGRVKMQTIVSQDGSRAVQRPMLESGAEAKIASAMAGVLDEVVDVDIHKVPVSWLDGLEAKQGSLMFKALFMFEEENNEVVPKSD